MYAINERPNVTEVHRLEDGYMTRTLCLVDGMPAEVEITVDFDHRQKYSTFRINTWNPDRMQWDHVADMKSAEVGRMPVIHDDPETLPRLNEVAATLWEMATLIVRTGRQRREDLDIDTYVREQLSLDEARAGRSRIRMDERLDALALNRVSPEAKKFAEAVDGMPYGKRAAGGLTVADAVAHDAEVDPFASGDHDEAEAAADAVTPGRPVSDSQDQEDRL